MRSIFVSSTTVKPTRLRLRLVDFLVRISSKISMSSSLYYRYASTPDFTYSGDTLRHNNGETVTFSNGDTLTMDLSGIRFLVGIIFEWS